MEIKNCVVSINQICIYIYIPSLTESTNSFKKIDKDKQTLESAKDQSWKAKISQASGK